MSFSRKRTQKMRARVRVQKGDLLEMGKRGERIFFLFFMGRSRGVEKSVARVFWREKNNL